MMGEAIEDPYGIESHEPFAQGLGLLPLRTRFKRKKSTARVTARPNPGWFAANENAPDISGYEIHMGSVTPTDADAPAFTVVARNGEYARYADGAVSSAGNVVGTMIHGIFENASIRTRFARRVTAASQPAGTWRRGSKSRRGICSARRDGKSQYRSESVAGHNWHLRNPGIRSDERRRKNLQ